MGYITNLLPKALTNLGHDVHVFASTAQFYYHSPDYQKTYQPFLGPPIVDPCVKQIDGYTLHRLPLLEWRGRIGMRGLWAALRSFQPQIVQTVDVVHFDTYQAALAAPVMGYKLFTGCHVHASVFPAANEHSLDWKLRLKLWASYQVPGRILDLVNQRCYAIGPDPANIAIHFFGIAARKVDICPLGVDTDIFYPAYKDQSLENRHKLRQDLGVKETEILCIYTGRFAADKNPLCLAQAIHSLRASGLPYRGLFIGDGIQAEAIRRCDGSIIHSFVPTVELAPYYRAADIGVWPQQESTSMLDAASSGLPLIVSDRIQTRERIQGSGLMYQEGDTHSLIETLKKLGDANLRQKMGHEGARKMLQNYSWLAIAERRVQDYEASLKGAPLEPCNHGMTETRGE